MRFWTDEEIAFLEDSWGSRSIPAIAKKLERTVNAVKVKAVKLGLGRHIHNGEYITLNQLVRALGRPFAYGYTVQQWKEKGLPVKIRKSIERQYQVIYIDDFWKWAEKNRYIIDFSKVEKNILGAEPNWVEEQRQADIAAAKYRPRRWTKEDDGMLKNMLKAYRYSYRDISVKLGRTEGAIKRRMQDLKLMERPLKADNHIPWTDEEVEIIIEMYKKGYIAEIMAEKVNRSTSAIRGKIERMIKEGELKTRLEYRKSS